MAMIIKSYGRYNLQINLIMHTTITAAPSFAFMIGEIALFLLIFLADSPLKIWQLYKYLRNLLFHSVMVCENIFRARPRPNG